MSYRRFLLVFALLAALGFAPFGLSMLLVRQSGEMLTYAQTVDRQLARHALFGPAFNADHYLYKCALYDAVRPDVAVVGSSTMIPFRERCFTARFLNCCRTADDLPELESFVTHALAVHPPKVMLVGLDFWWFRYKQDPDRRYTPSANPGDEWSWAKLSRIYTLIARGEAEGRDLGPLVHTLAHGLPPDRIGLMALHDRGFRPDGSFDYGPAFKVMPDTRQELARQMRDLLDAAEERFIRSDRTYDENIRIVARILERIRAAGTHAVLLFPPVVGELDQELQRRPTEYGYVPQIFEKLRAAGIPFADYHDGAALGSDFTEFYDAIHGGDVTMMRLLLDLAGKDGQVAAVLDRDYLARTVAEHAGVTRLP
ncbi:MAG: hypothetical protein AB7D57_04035 [Desulfovibrionaceae bacterium]